MRKPFKVKTHRHPNKGQVYFIIKPPCIQRGGFIMPIKTKLIELIETIENPVLLEWLYKFIQEGLKMWIPPEPKEGGQ